MLGTVVGALVISFLKNGFNHAGQPQYVQEMVTGAIIVAAVALDRWRARMGTGG